MSFQELVARQGGDKLQTSARQKPSKQDLNFHNEIGLPDSDSDEMARAIKNSLKDQGEW